MALKDSIASSAAMLKSLAKVALLSRPTRFDPGSCAGRIVILGNGPSLNDTIRDHIVQLKALPLMAVNFAANAPIFKELKPQFYVLADPHFFLRPDDTNVAALYATLNTADFYLTLLVPVKYAAVAKRLITNQRIRLATFNFVGLEGPAWFERFVYNRGLGMPRPRNVLIPAIMCAIRLGFSEILVAGADHSWLRTLEVNDRNEVVSVQPHFYNEDKREQQRVRSEYTAYRLHQILYSFYVAFRSYFGIRRFADAKGVKVVNITPGSFIDAFERGSL